MIESANFNLLDLSATHHTASNDSLLDLIIASDKDLIAAHGQLPAPAFSHHDLIHSSVLIRTPKPKPMVLPQRNFARLNKVNFENDASRTKWISVENIPTVDGKLEFLSKNIIETFDRHAPVRPVKMKHRPTPWINDTVRKHMSRRDRAFRRYKKCRTDENWATYKKLRNRCNLICRNARSSYISEQIELSTPAGLWKFLKTLGLGKIKGTDIKVTLDLNDLNKHFSSSATINPNIKFDTLLEITNLSRPNISPFDFTPVSHDLTKKIILSLKSKAVGSDDIGRNMVIHLLDHILPAIVHIINYSLNTGEFPDQWRKAHVLPLPKTPNRRQFRPISILPFLSKIIESVVHKQVTEFLTDGDLFDPLQSGFRIGHSTTTALLKVTEDIRSAMENSLVTILVLVDFSNAFNAVDHDLLLAILNHLNFSSLALKWFSSYLLCRRQTVRNDQSFSDWCELEAGVPQGGILSPLLFTIFINMLSCKFSSHYHFYADDLQLYQHVEVDKLAAAISSLNNDLLQLKNWCVSYGIQVNPSKCQAIIIGSSRQLSKINSHNPTLLFYDNVSISFSPVVKDLGILIDSYLNWSAQIKETSRKFYATLHSIIRLKNFLPTKTKLSLVNSLLLPIINYADVAYLDLSQEFLNKLDRLLNTCIRFVFGLRKYDHVSEYRAKLKWLPIRERRKLRILCLLYSVLNDPHSPQYLKSKFRFLSDTHLRDLRSKDNFLLSVPKHSSSFRGDSFEIAAVRLWNVLPINVKKAPSKQTFKRLVYNLFIQNLYPTEGIKANTIAEL